MMERLFRKEYRYWNTGIGLLFAGKGFEEEEKCIRISGKQ